MGEPMPAPVQKHRWSWTATCPVCGDRFPAGRWLMLVYSMHYAEVHLGIRVFRDPRSAS